MHATCKAYQLGQMHQHCVDGVACEAEEVGVQAPDSVVIETANRPHVAQQQALHPKNMIFMLHDDHTCQNPTTSASHALNALHACIECSSAHQGW